MQDQCLKITFLGLSITSSWGNGHATTYRALIRELSAMGHDVLFLERDVPWYAANRDLPNPPYVRTELYNSIEELQQKFAREVAESDAVIVGSYVPDGVEVGRWVTGVAEGLTAFYDIDTPVTMAKLERGDEEYLSRDLIPTYDMYLSFTGGPILEFIENQYGARHALPLYCSVDPGQYYPEEQPARWDLGYMGTYSEDRQPTLDRLLIEPARRSIENDFVVAGPMYPASIVWPGNVERIEHVPPAEHRRFYNQQSFTLNITRADMIRAGYCPGVRLFEAAACGVPVISDYWTGLEEFFAPNHDILLACEPDDVLRYISTITQGERREIGGRARQRVLAHHTAAHRARELESYIVEHLPATRRP